MPIPTYFIFKGIDSRDMGAVVMNYPPVTIPSERVKEQEIIGRSGALTLAEGTDVYKNISMSIDCFIPDLSMRDDIATWLRGKGDLILGSNPNRCYKARIANQIDMSKAVRGYDETRIFSVSFSCDPFQYEADPQPLVLYVPFVAANPSGISSNPLISVYGSGDITLNIGEVSVSLTGIADSVTIDCDAKVAYTTIGNNVAITLNDEEWPSLAPGGNAISWTGSVSKVIIWPNWRWV